MNRTFPTDADVERGLSDTSELSFMSLQLERAQDYWVLTYWKTHVVLRLRIQDDELADFDANERVIFEIKLTGMQDFCILADIVISAGSFFSACLDLRSTPGLERFPLAFRADFFLMVRRWGDRRLQCGFAPTVPGTPFNP